MGFVEELPGPQIAKPCWMWFFRDPACFRLTNGPALLNFGPQFFKEDAQWENIFSVLEPPACLALDGGQDLLQEFTVGPRVSGGLLGGGTDLDTFNHKRTFEADGLELPEYSSEIDLTGAELGHHLPLGTGTILRAKTGDVPGDRLQLSYGILAGVIDDVTGIVPNLEV
jgi:hypothetical protein